MKKIDKLVIGCIICFIVCLVYAIKWKQMPDIMCYRLILDALN